jgi:hypothetical protein
VGQHHFSDWNVSDILTNRYRVVTAVDFEKSCSRSSAFPPIRPLVHSLAAKGDVDL